MPVRTIFTLAMFWVLSLLAVGTIANGQSYGVNPLPEPKIVAGPDLGFRVEGEQKGAPVGRLVVRINGRWVEANLGSGSLGTHPLRQ